MPRNEVYQLTASGGVGLHKFLADGLPPECECDEVTGLITCDENVEKKIHKFTGVVEDSLGNQKTTDEIPFEIVGESYESLIDQTEDALFIVFEGVALCPGGCSQEDDYTTYEAASPEFFNGRPILLTKDVSNSSPDPGVGALWRHTSSDTIYTKKLHGCPEPYGEPSEQAISLDVEVKLRDTGASPGYLLEIYVNRDTTGGTLFDGKYNMSDPYGQLFSKVFHNSNNGCDENGAINGSTVIGAEGNGTFSPVLPCEGVDNLI